MPKKCNLMVFTYNRVFGSIEKEYKTYQNLTPWGETSFSGILPLTSQYTAPLTPTIRD